MLIAKRKTILDGHGRPQTFFRVGHRFTRGQEQTFCLKNILLLAGLCWPGGVRATPLPPPDPHVDGQTYVRLPNGKLTQLTSGQINLWIICSYQV